MAGRTPTRAPLLALLPALALAGCGDLEDEPDAEARPIADRTEGAPAATGPAAPFDEGPQTPPPEALPPASPAPAATGPVAPSPGVTPGTSTPGAPATDVPPTASSATDCAASLPCALRSPDGAFELRLTRVGGAGSDGGDAVVVEFAIEALTRDLAFGVDPASTVASGRITAAATGASVGDGPVDATDVSAPARYAVQPGTPVPGRVHFAGGGPGAGGALDRVELVVHESGDAVRMAFAAVPYGPTGSGAIDCALILPCRATSPDGALALRVDAVGLERWHHYTRTIVDWSVTGARAAELELADAASATTDTGHDMEYYGIELGGTTSRGEGALGDALPAGGVVTGRTVFRRSPPEGASHLSALELVIGERRSPAVPGWRASFANLPVAR